MIDGFQQSRAQYGNIEEPKTSQVILSYPKSSTSINSISLVTSDDSNHFSDSVSGPEKAGVGGSIPSLATNPQIT